MSQEKIYRFCADIKVTEVDCIFIAREDEVEKLRGKKLPLGEVVDNVSMDINWDELGVFCDDPEKVQVVKSVFGDNITGSNPIEKFYDFYHLECDEKCPQNCDGSH
jgi:hypothetical protein